MDGVFRNLCIFLVIAAMSSCQKKGRNETGVGVTEPDKEFIEMQLDAVSKVQFQNPDSAFNILKSIKQLTYKISDKQLLSETGFLEGCLLYNKNQYSEAKTVLSNTLILARECNDKLTEARCLERLASLHLETDNPAYALKLYYQALPLFINQGDKEGIAKVYNILGIYKTQTNVYDTAVYYLNTALRFNTELQNARGIVNNKANLADLYERIGKTDTSKYLYYSIIDDLKARKDRLTLPVIMFNMFYFFERLDDHKTALLYLDSALVIFEQNRDTALLAEAYGQKAQLLCFQSQLSDADRYAQKAAMMARTIDSPAMEIYALEILIKTDSASGNYYSAYTRTRRLLELNDTLNQRKLRNNSKVTELEYQNAKYLTNIKSQKEAANNMRVRKNLYMVLASLSSIVLVLAVTIFISIRKNHKRQHELALSKLRNKELLLNFARQEAEVNKLQIEQAHNELRLKEHEEISNALELERKERLLSDINRKIKSSDVPGNNSLLVSEIVSSISQQLIERSKENNDLFNKKLSAVHKNFFKKLVELHPTLTKSEIKFCGYLVVQLSGHQIATILNITPEAIKKTRYRIRRKIGLLPSQSLDNYLITLM